MGFFLQLKRIVRTGKALPLIVLAGCASLPDVLPLQEHRTMPEGPTIVAADGELSKQKKRALLSGMAAKVGPTDILAKHIVAEEAISGQPLVAGNKVTLLDDGPETMRAMTAAIRAARDHVNLQTYIFRADEVGQALADLLIEKRADGVVVNLIYDSVGSIDTPRQFFLRMRDAGIAVLEYNPVNPLHAWGNWQINRRDHRKLLVVDGRVAFTGGVNISKVYGKSSFLQQGKPRRPADTSEAAWRDTHMQVEGPVVTEFQKLFFDTWQRKTGRLPAAAHYFPKLEMKGSALVRAIGSTPDRENYSVYETYVSAFAHADKYIHITTAYFVPDRQVLQAMIDAAQRGVEVKIIFPSFTDVGMLLHAGRSYYEELLAAGIKVYERETAMLHAKTAVIDGVWSTIGSTNIDMRSFLHNDELNAVVLSVDFAKRMDALFQRDLQQSVEVNAEQWRRRGMRQRLREWMARIFEYWL
jgi:cardiolipin synthase